jgi:2'-5' RNA ligase
MAMTATPTVAPAGLAEIVLAESMLPPAFVAKGASVSPMPTDAGLEAEQDDDEEDEADAAVLPSGVMVAFGLPEETATALAIEGGVPADELHVTLAYIGDVEDLSDPTGLIAAVTSFSVDAIPVKAQVTGFAIFVGDDESDCVAVALIDSPSMGRLREDLCRQLGYEGVDYSREHGFIPHVTLAFGSYEELTQLPMPAKTDLVLTHVAVAVGGAVQQFPLLGGRYNAGPFADEPFAMTAVAKADAAMRYTLAPLYVPEVDDSHDEYAKAEDLQAAVHDYVRGWSTSEDGRTIRLQHTPETRAGECVEIVTWPFEVKCALRKGDGSIAEVTMPPNTVYQGVVWEPWAWELVKEGKIGGLSMGGMAVRVEE